jgi:hypothetical protein
MKKYSNAVPGHLIKRFNRWLMAGLLFICLVVLAVVVSLALWFLHQQNENAAQPSSRGETTINNPFKTFETDYFTLKADETWQFVREESSSNTFVYRSFRNGLVLRDVTVFVNTLPPNLLLTGILSADAAGDRFKIRGISGHCKKALPPNYLDATRNPADVIIDGVSFTCQADNDQTILGTGIRSSGLSASLKRQNGTRAGYFLLYHDLESNPKTAVFKDIIEGFRSR